MTTIFGVIITCGVPAGFSVSLSEWRLLRPPAKAAVGHLCPGKETGPTRRGPTPKEPGNPEYSVSERVLAGRRGPGGPGRPEGPVDETLRKDQKK